MKPMLAKLGTESDLGKKGFIYEPKLDGYRALCFANDKIKLLSRREKDLTFQYPELNLRKSIKAKNCILDGEIVIYDEKGDPSFRLLQERGQTSKKQIITQPATYIVFDILMKDNKDLKILPLSERKQILEKTIIENESLQLIHYTTDGKKLWKIAKKRGIEGVIAKEKNGKYHPGLRTGSWIKIKALKTMDCIIVGYTTERRAISALALAAYDNDKLRYIGKVGTGFNEKMIALLKEKLGKIGIEKQAVETNMKNIHWVKPENVCEVKYLEFTKDRMLRAPSFMNLRDDKLPEECAID